MDWIQFTILYVTILGFIGSLITVILWTRSESSSDRRDMMSLIKAIQDEMKDFHGRLCTIEERYRQK